MSSHALSLSAISVSSLLLFSYDSLSHEALNILHEAMRNLQTSL